MASARSAVEGWRGFTEGTGRRGLDDKAGGG